MSTLYTITGTAEDRAGLCTPYLGAEYGTTPEEAIARARQRLFAEEDCALLNPSAA